MKTSPLKILAVDDAQLLLWALQSACRGHALDIDIAVTNEQAFTLIEQRHYDLFLLDFNMKNQSRHELLSGIDRRCPYIPIIFMTTSNLNSREINDTINTLRKQGAWHLIEKPFSLQRLVNIIELTLLQKISQKISLNDVAHHYENEKREQRRRLHVEPITFYYTTFENGSPQKFRTSGVLTDISDHGVGLLSNTSIEAEQVIHFTGTLMEKCGIVTWSKMLPDKNCRAGIQIY